MNGKICTKCRIEVSLKYHQYCYTCLRVACGCSPEPKFRRDPSNRDKCCKCKVAPRAKGKNYCKSCANLHASNWRKKKGSWKNYLTDEQRRKATVRRFIGHRAARGTFSRQPCVVCGVASTEFHHLDYEPRTLNVMCLCEHHHDEVGRLVKSGLTDQQAVEYLKSQLPVLPAQPPTG